jgi:hypothetical protein
MLSEFNEINYTCKRTKYRQEWKLTLKFSCLFVCLFACSLGFSTTHCLFCWLYNYKWVILFVSVPLEINILTREYFNRWYSLLPSFLAIILIEIPIQVWDTTLYHFTVCSIIIILSVHNPLNLNMLQACNKRFNTYIQRLCSHAFSVFKYCSHHFCY